MGQKFSRDAVLELLRNRVDYYDGMEDDAAEDGLLDSAERWHLKGTAVARLFHEIASMDVEE